MKKKVWMRYNLNPYDIDVLGENIEKHRNARDLVSKTCGEIIKLDVFGTGEMDIDVIFEEKNLSHSQDTFDALELENVVGEYIKQTGLPSYICRGSNYKLMERVLLPFGKKLNSGWNFPLYDPFGKFVGNLKV